MNGWFQTYSEHMFQPFGTSHQITLMVFLIGTAGFLLLSGYGKLKAYKWLRILLFSMLFLSEVSYQTWAITNEVWAIADYLPLHLCGVASITGMIALITLNPTLVKIQYFIGLLPAALALVTPDLPYDYQHFRFWKFFIHHMAISWTSLFLILTIPVTLTFRTMWKVFGGLLVYAFFVGMINNAIGSNYLYLNGPPIDGTVLNYLGTGWLYIVNLVLLALFVFHALYFSYKLLKNRKSL